MRSTNPTKVARMPLTAQEDRRDQQSRAALLRRLRNEFSDMPGLRLTREQVGKLLAQRSDVCERVLQQLVAEGTLKRANGDAYCRSDLGG